MSIGERGEADGHFYEGAVPFSPDCFELIDLLTVPHPLQGPPQIVRSIVWHDYR